MDGDRHKAQRRRLALVRFLQYHNPLLLTTVTVAASTAPGGAGGGDAGEERPSRLDTRWRKDILTEEKEQGNWKLRKGPMTAESNKGIDSKCLRPRIVRARDLVCRSSTLNRGVFDLSHSTWTPIASLTPLECSFIFWPCKTEATRDLFVWLRGFSIHKPVDAVDTGVGATDISCCCPFSRAILTGIQSLGC